MTDENASPPEGGAPQDNSTSPDTFDVTELLGATKNLITKPLQLIDEIKAIAKDPAGYFSSGKDGSINDSLAFYLVITAVMVVFAWLGAILSFQIVAIFMALPLALFGAVLHVVIGTAVLFLIAKFLAKGEGTFWDSAKIVCRLSWVFLISSFPLWTFLPSIVSALISIVAILLWAYLAIPSVTAKFGISEGKHAIAIWAVSGVFCFFILIGAITGKAVETAGDYYIDKVEEIQREVLANAEAVRAEVAGKVEAQQAARKAEEQGQAAVAAAKASGGESPAKQVKTILEELKAVGAVDAPSNLRGALRKLNGHLQNADFSGIEAKGLDLRSVDLTGAKFDGAVIDGWWFHGFQNEPGSKLDGASFKNATFIKTNMKGVSLVEANFSGAKLVSTKDFEVALSLDEANLTKSDFTDMTYTGPAMGKSLRLNRVVARDADFSGSQLPNVDLQYADIRGADFSDAVLVGVVLKRVDMTGAKFRNANLTEMEISPALKLDMQEMWGRSDTIRYEGADFSGANFNGVDLKYRHLRFCNFEGATFNGTDLEGAVLTGSDFSKADLTAANLQFANLAATNFSGANLKNTNWQYAHTAAANLKGHNINELVAKPNLYDSAKVPSSKAGKHPDNLEAIVTGSIKDYAGQDFSGKSFQGVRITKINFSGANFDGANFDYAEIGDTDFSLCSMKGATFRFARLNDINFDEANLSNAVFFGATFHDSSFRKAILTKADFRYIGRGTLAMSGKMTFDGADLTDADFSNARLAWSDQQMRHIPVIKPLGSIFFKKANLSDANFSSAWMEGVDFDGANLTGVNATDVNFAGVQSNFDTKWGGADFRNANMSFGNLSHTDVEVNMNGKTDFYTLKLRGSNWRGFKWILGAHIGPVDFSGCFFAIAPHEIEKNARRGYAGTNFFNVAMPGANFTDADLRYSSFGNVDLRGASFKNANCSETSWSIGNGMISNYESNLALHEERYNNISFSNTVFNDVDFASGDFKGSDFSSAKFNSNSRLNPNTTFNGPTGLKF